MSSCCTLRLKRRRAFSRDSPSCSLTSAKLTHPQTRPAGPNSYYREFHAKSSESGEIVGTNDVSFPLLRLHFETSLFPPPGPPTTPIPTKHRKIALGQSCKNKRFK